MVIKKCKNILYFMFIINKMSDKFKVDETAPFFSIAPTGSYGGVNSGIKSSYRIKSKDPQTKSVVKSSGIINNNLNTIPPTKTTILQYNSSYGPSFDWSEVTWTLDNKLPNFSYFANAVQLNGSVPNNSSLINVAIGTLVTSIGDGTFASCTSLTSVTIPNSVTNIGDAAFVACTSLASITIPNSVTIIQNTTFYACTSLTSIEIPNSVTSIGIYSFQDCTGLTSIEIPNSVESIGNSAFAGCTGLTSIEIPNSVESIGENAFIGCTQLSTVIISTNNPLGIESPKSNVAFYGIFVTTITPSD